MVVVVVQLTLQTPADPGSNLVVSSIFYLKLKEKRIKRNCRNHKFSSQTDDWFIFRQSSWLHLPACRLSRLVEDEHKTWQDVTQRSHLRHTDQPVQRQTVQRDRSCVPQQWRRQRNWKEWLKFRKDKNVGIRNIPFWQIFIWDNFYHMLLLLLLLLLLHLSYALMPSAVHR